MRKFVIGVLAAALVMAGLSAGTVSADGRKQCSDGDRFVVKVLKGKLGCKNARRELGNFMDRVYASNPPCYPGKCRKESPKGWRCKLENKQLTEEPGRLARCKRKSDGSKAVLIFLGESSSGRSAEA